MLHQFNCDFDDTYKVKLIIVDQVSSPSASLV